jgi:P-type Cu2+ transporter
VAEQSPQNKATDSAASTIFFTHAGRITAIPVRQHLRPDAISVVQALITRSLDVLILSGDRPNTVEPVARQLRITQWRAGLSPAEKIAAIDKLKSQGRSVLMVGDGLNDAPALAAATASISPITAVQLTQTRADALFLGDQLAPVLDAIVVSRRGRSLMRQNLWLAVVYNILAVPIAMAGMATPLVAAAAMSGSSILVTLNALRGRRSGIPHLVREIGPSPWQAKNRLDRNESGRTHDAMEDFPVKNTAAAGDLLQEELGFVQ